MPFKVLESKKQSRDILRAPDFKRKFKLLGRFYEHINNTAGFDFESSDFKKLLKETPQEVDPVTTQTHLPKNFASKFNKADKIIPIEQKYPLFTPRIIKKNYKIYSVYTLR